MNIECPVSLGELIDKLSILTIKLRFIAEQQKRTQIEFEENKIKSIVKKLELNGIEEYIEKLVDVNTRLWKIEDDIRQKEFDQEFDQTFIQLARSVYMANDKRFEIKFEINQKYNSAIKEVKSYRKY